MNWVKKVVLLFLVFSIISVTAYAGGTNRDTHSSIGNAKLKEESLTEIINYSSVFVNVTKTTPDGNTTQIYSGPLSGYDGGRWTFLDFSNIQGVLVFDWESDDSMWIVPVSQVASTPSPSLSDNTVSTLNETNNLMSVSSDLEISSQIKINGVTVNEQGMRIIDNANMNCSFVISNSAAKSDGVIAILATYTEEGRIHSIKTFEVDVAAGQTENIQIIYQFDADKEYTGKLMIWNKYTKLMPIRASIDFSQTSGINAYYYNSDNRLLQIDKTNGKSVIFTYDNMGNLLSRTIRE